MSAMLLCILGLAMHTESIQTCVHWVTPVGQDPQLHHRIDILNRVLRVRKRSTHHVTSL